MKIAVNEKFLQRRATIARWSTLVGLGVLFVGLILSFNQQYYYWSLPALIVGFILANISGFNSNRYVKEPRPDQSLAKALKGFDLTTEEKAALSSGDIRWIESKLGTLDEPLRTWLTARMTQEKW